MLTKAVTPKLVTICRQSDTLKSHRSFIFQGDFELMMRDRVPERNHIGNNGNNGIRPKRETHDLIVEILTLTRRGKRKTHIAATIGLNYAQSKKYLDRLEQSGCIAETSGIWKTTDKGKNVIDACEACRKITHQFVQ